MAKGVNSTVQRCFTKAHRSWYSR